MNNDLISRQAAIFEVHRQLWYRMSQQGMKDRIDEWLENLPPAQQKTGRWIPIKPLLTAARCSECKSAFADRTNYCPFCGAKMEGGTE